MEAISPYVSVNMFVTDSEQAFSFYKAFFGAELIESAFTVPRGERNARFKIGSSLFALADENIEWGAKSPLALDGTPICIQLYVENVEAVIEDAIKNGAQLEMEIIITPQNIQVGNITDPFGHIWSISKQL